jgi:C-terminal, D2-small domain, of ClpB protein
MTAAAIKQQLDGSTQNHLDGVLDKELGRLQQRVAETAKGEFRFFLTDSARGFLLLNATEQHYDARRLKLTIERLIVYPLANLFATDRIQVGDRIRIDRDQDQPRLNFIREVASSHLRFATSNHSDSWTIPVNLGECMDMLWYEVPRLL